AIPLSSDGSDRRFFKIRWKDKPAVAIEPAPGDIGTFETYSYVDIGNHLARVGIPVPKIYDFNKDTGVIVVEYLGDRHLQTEILALISQNKWSQVKGLYRQALSMLAKMQVCGCRGFNRKWCYNSEYYDSKLAREREAFYFLQSFVEGLMGFGKTLELEDELTRLALQVDLIDNKEYFLHRDFQSRNILVWNGALRIIDFQGGRLGPLGYDVAALLLDPYVALPENIWSELLEFYLDELDSLNIALDKAVFEREFYLLALFRTMQALGAYSYLYLIKRKGFFKAYISPAFSNLKTLLVRKDFEELDKLKLLVADISEKNQNSPLKIINEKSAFC
ncbi:MAG: phosphotransferase, partial [Deltaproteobacteria bacterium]|nr:phosphotransferase [Deltaproteobacteria bacterium]